MKTACSTLLVLSSLLFSKREFRLGSPLYMLPADDIRRFEALPSVRQAEHP